MQRVPRTEVRFCIHLHESSVARFVVSVGQMQAKTVFSFGNNRS
jgi:hypothetical protein